MEVDIMGLSKADTSTTKVKQEDDPDATECSSSFDDSLDSERENVSATGDVEVESHSCNVNDDFDFDGHENSLLFPTRKKKLTAHWRNFIRPLMWRCKWAELKMKDIQSQASKYDKELAAYEQMKKIEQDQLKVPEFASKSSLWTSSSSRMAHRKIMKRRKRKKVEDSTDIKSYTSRHCLFSYLDNKNSNPDEEIVCKPEQNDNAHSEINTNEDWLFHNSKDDLEPILLKIENLQAKVRKLKSGLGVVISENPSSSCAISPTRAAENCHDIAVPDITESTVGFLSSVDITSHETQIRDTSEAIMDNVQLHNRVVTETGESSKKAIKDKLSKKHSEAKQSKIAASTSNLSLKSQKFEEQHLNSEAKASKIAASTSNLSLKKRKFEEKHLSSEAKPSKFAASTSNLSLKSRKFEEQQQSNAVNPGLDQVTSFPKAKRKRGERKPGCGSGWNS